MNASRKRTQNKRKMINLVIKDYAIRYIDAKKPNLYGVAEIGEYILPPNIIREGKIVDPDRLRSILKDCVRRWKIRDREVQFLVPDPFVMVRKIDIPLDVKDEEIKGHLYLELGSNIHLPFEDPLFDFDFLEAREDKKEILLFAAPEHIVTQYAELIESAGLKPVAADISSLAIYRLFHQMSKKSRSQPTGSASTLSIQYDLHTVTISIFNNHKLMLVRQLKLGLSPDSWETTVDRMGASTTVWNGDEAYLKYEAKVIMEEIQRVINFYYSSISRSDEELESIILTGDYPYLENITEDLQQIFGKTPITFSEEWFEAQSGELITPKYFLTLGLALKGGT
ncbi:type IV pilus biogenesis protein PilM [Paenibacillus lentus]|uniref:type IV pilus biogenesis protein PilM n=1 Tax=Paenibacillus lentus TaxID=1338368 RepID=UPI003651692F